MYFIFLLEPNFKEILKPGILLHDFFFKKGSKSETTVT